jgi:hypothetical protein
MVSADPAPWTGPDIARLEEELAGLGEELAQAEAELAEARALLAAFTRAHGRLMAPLFAELDEIDAQIAEFCAATSGRPDDRRDAREAPAIRVPTFRLWWQDGQYWRKGTTVTVVPWLVSLGAHLLYDGVTARDPALSGLGAATTVLYFGVSLGIQRVLFAARTLRISRDNGIPGPPQSGRTW